MELLKSFPDQEELLKWYRNQPDPSIYKVNGHVHTPYSFSSFNNIEQAFALAVNENIKILGINDFYVTDGYVSFYENACKNKIFPLFNVEFIGLLKEAQANNIRINDPNNSGRIYFTGKGLRYPFSIDENYRNTMDAVIEESQVQVKAMIDKVNQWFRQIDISIELNYSKIKKDYAKELVRERHIAKAIRIAVSEKYVDANQHAKAFDKIFGKPLKSKLTDNPSLENEIRGNLLKAGGKAFVEEDEKSFLGIDLLIKMIVNAGGIPCYPVLLDDSNGKITEFESDFQQLHDELLKLKVACIELIPNRNDFEVLKKFVQFFNGKGFVVLFGTEHNTPDLIPLTVVTRGSKPLDDELLTISYENACVIAAHQYLVSKSIDGYVTSSGQAKIAEKKAFIELGKAVMEWFLNRF
jgi:hypothetical protein